MAKEFTPVKSTKNEGNADPLLVNIGLSEFFVSDGAFPEGVLDGALEDPETSFLGDVEHPTQPSPFSGTPEMPTGGTGMVPGEESTFDTQPSGVSSGNSLLTGGSGNKMTQLGGTKLTPHMRQPQQPQPPQLRNRDGTPTPRPSPARTAVRSPITQPMLPPRNSRIVPLGVVKAAPVGAVAPPTKQYAQVAQVNITGLAKTGTMPTSNNVTYKEAPPNKWRSQGPPHARQSLLASISKGEPGLEAKTNVPVWGRGDRQGGGGGRLEKSPRKPIKDRSRERQRSPLRKSPVGSARNSPAREMDSSKRGRSRSDEFKTNKVSSGWSQGDDRQARASDGSKHHDKTTEKTADKRRHTNQSAAQETGWSSVGSTSSRGSGHHSGNQALTGSSAGGGSAVMLSSSGVMRTKKQTHSPTAPSNTNASANNLDRSQPNSSNDLTATNNNLPDIRTTKMSPSKLSGHNIDDRNYASHSIQTPSDDSSVSSDVGQATNSSTRSTSRSNSPYGTTKTPKVGKNRRQDDRQVRSEGKKGVTPSSSTHKQVNDKQRNQQAGKGMAVDTPVPTDSKSRALSLPSILPRWVHNTIWYTQRGGILTVAVLILSHVVSFLVCLVGLVLAFMLAIFLMILQLHKYAVREALSNYNVAFCFVFPFNFQFLVSLVKEWAPHWAPVCLWYSFLIQLLCTRGKSSAPSTAGSDVTVGNTASGGMSSQANGTTTNATGGGGAVPSRGTSGGMVSVFRIVLPLAFVAEGVSGRTALLDLNGAELLVVSFLLAAVKMQCISSPIFMVSWAIQVLATAATGFHPVLQYCQFVLALTSLHICSRSMQTDTAAEASNACDSK